MPWHCMIKGTTSKGNLSERGGVMSQPQHACHWQEFRCTSLSSHNIVEKVVKIDELLREHVTPHSAGCLKIIM
jgi:hypothetical protein